MLLNISFEELKDFFTIVLWISIPIVLIASGVAVYLHYRKKNKDTDFGLAYASPGSMYMTGGDGASKHDGYDKTELGMLLRKYEQDIEHHLETHEQLKEEFNELEEKYMQLLQGTNSKEPSLATTVDSELVNKLQTQVKAQEIMIAELETALSNNEVNEIAADKEAEWKKLLEEQEVLLANKQASIEKQENELNQSLGQLHLQKEHIAILEKEKLELNKQLDLADKHAPLQLTAMEKKWQEEKNELLTKAELLNSKLGTVHKENEWLKEQANKIAPPSVEAEEYKIKYEQLEQQFVKANQENEEMKSKMSNQQYMEDVVQEKKLQIEFLQNQLDQRIKTFREMEKQYQADSARLTLLDQTAKKYEEELHSVNNLLHTKEQDYANLRETTEKTIGSKVTHIELLEREMGNLQQQNNTLSVSLDDASKLNATISKQTNQQTQRISELESKLEVSSQLFIKIYKELSRSFEGTMANYPFANGNGVSNGNGAAKKIEDNNFIEILSSTENVNGSKQ
jgi:hypothetical protein